MDGNPHTSCALQRVARVQHVGTERIEQGPAGEEAFFGLGDLGKPVQEGGNGLGIEERDRGEARGAQCVLQDLEEAAPEDGGDTKGCF